MKRTFFTVCATLVALMSYGQNAGQEFTMKPVEYTILDNTPYGFARSGSNHTDSDISVYSRNSVPGILVGFVTAVPAP